MTGWQRPQFAPDGGHAFVSYFVYGTFEERLSCSHESYRTSGLPEGVSAWRKERGSQEGWFASWEDGHFGRQLRESGLSDVVLGSSDALVVQGTIRDPPDLKYLRDVVGVLTAAFDASGTAILDPQTLSWWAPQKWRETFFVEDAPYPRRRVVILYSEEENGGGTWYHTRGMRKFGRPDLSMHHVPEDLAAGVLDMFNRFIEMQAFGAVVQDGQAIRMHSLPEGLRCRIQGNVEDYDFNNVHIEVCWPE